MNNIANTIRTAAQTELWQRLCAHPFECAEQGLDFTARLAREQGWSRDEARAAIGEYRKFCFLSVGVGRFMTPSEAVDQVWHLHLTYTLDYWKTFCPNVLGTELHHEPTRGNPAEAGQFHEQYADTLAAYREHFGAPPVKYWPGTFERFRHPSRFRWVDRERHLVLPRPRMPALRARVSALLSVGLLSIAPLALADESNPLDWSGGPFIALYIGLAVLCAFATAFWRRSLRDNGSSDTGAGLSTWEIAYLAGGNERVVDAAVAELMSNGAVEWDGVQRRLVVNGEKADRLSPPLDRIVQQLRIEGRPRELARRLDNDLAQVRRNLENRGLLLDAAAKFRAAWMPALVPAALIAFGLTKLYLGWARGRPIGFLFFLMLIVGVITFTVANKLGSRSRAGDKAIKNLTDRHAHTARAPRSNELPLAVALAGTAIMATTAYAAYHDARVPASSSSGDSSSSSDSSSSDSGDSGGGGCGGCGGGGGGD
jgi:uncharacterized protein (TIGR04222 family)